MPRVDLLIPLVSLLAARLISIRSRGDGLSTGASHATGSEIRVGFGTQSGANFGTLRRDDGTGVPHVVASTNLSAWGPFTPVTPYVRVEVVGGTRERGALVPSHPGGVNGGIR
jgi:hypothetical protein